MSSTVELRRRPDCVTVIANPTARQGVSKINKILNELFEPVGIKWKLLFAAKRGDVYQLTQRAVKDGADVIAAYGGDGTLSECAAGIIGSSIPLAILPAGTANIMAIELDIPTIPTEAARLICQDTIAVKEVDLGQVGHRYFLARLSTGVEATMIMKTPPRLKRIFGVWAYSLSLLHSIVTSKEARYYLRLDDTEVECAGITCIVANSGKTILRKLPLGHGINIADGILDIIVVSKNNIRSLNCWTISRFLQQKEKLSEHWQAREITVATAAPEVVQCDGEMIGSTPFSARVLPRAMKIVVPNAP